MHALTPAQTLRHIEHKLAMRELASDVAERMRALHAENPTQSYGELHSAALRRPLPDTAFHVTAPENYLTILQHGLRPANPAEGWRGASARMWLRRQPTAIYLSDVHEAMSGAHSPSLPFLVWRIDGLHELSPKWQHDNINPTCWAVLEPLHPRMLSLHATIR